MSNGSNNFRGSIDSSAANNNLGCGCPGSTVRTIDRNVTSNTSLEESSVGIQSQLNQWPCQIQLVPVNAPYFENAKLLVAADCTAFAYGNIHNVL